MSAQSGDKIVKATLKFERERWRLTVLKIREGAKEPVLAFRGKYESFGDALDGLDDYMRGVVIV